MIGDILAGCVIGFLVPQQSSVIVAGSVLVGSWKWVVARRHRRVDEANEVGEEAMMGDQDKVSDPVELYWKDLEVSMDVKGEKTVLVRASGVARPGRLLGILGPSGAGKTTLLNALVQQIPVSDHLSVRGTLMVNGVSAREVNAPVAYVRQESLFFSHLTVRETLELAAKMQLSGMKVEERKEVASHLLKKMGLVKCADTVVGDAKSRGISGGEKKRLNIACELISAPSLIFLDEPTSGLDSFQAQQVMESLKRLAEDGRTVVCTIHQPRSSIFALMDDVLLLSEGRTMFTGPIQDSLQFFQELGHPCPELTNPAEFISDLIAVDYSSPEATEESAQRINAFSAAFKFSALPSQKTEGRGRRSRESHIGWFGQFRLLFTRAWKQITRDKKTNLARLIPSIMSAFLFGSIYWKLKLTQTGAMDRMGLLQVASINSAMLSLVRTLYIFPNERTIVNSERAKGSYGVLPYLTSKLVAELPVAALFPSIFGTILYPMARLHPGWKRYGSFLGTIVLNAFACASFGMTLGAASPSTEAAVAVGPASMVLFIVFGGYYVNEMSVPRILRFLPEISIIRWTFEGLCINEFRGLQFETTRRWDAKDGEMFLERLSFSDDDLSTTMTNQLRFLMANYLLTYTILRLKKPKFAQIVGDGRSETENQENSMSGATEVM